MKNTIKWKLFIPIKDHKNLKLKLMLNVRSKTIKNRNIQITLVNFFQYFTRKYKNGYWFVCLTFIGDKRNLFFN